MNLNKTIFIDKKNLIIKTKNDKGYIFHKLNKKYIFLNKEVIEALLEGERQKISFLEFLNAFHDDDKGYIKKILNILNEMDLFKIFNKYEKNFRCIHMELTHKCNLACKHCFLNASPNKKTNLLIEDWKNIIDKIVHLNPEQFVFTGGEPLMLDYFKDLVYYSYEKLPKTSFILSTNGTLIDKYDISFFKKFFSKICISLDGYDQESSDKVRGNGVFEKVINNIKALKENGFSNIDLSFTQGDYNKKHRMKFVQLCNDLNVNYTFRTFSPSGRGKENINLFLNKNKSIPGSILQVIESASKDYMKGEKVSKSCLACDAGDQQIVIDDTANVYPCVSLRSDNFIISNMLDNDCISKIKKFKGGYNLYEKLIYNNIDCKNCDLNIFCWNCPGNFEQVHGSGELHYWCKNIKPNLNKIIWGEV